MWSYIKKAEYKRDYQLVITFENGEQKLVDLKNSLDGEVFEPLKNINYFKKVFVNSDIGTITWENEADFAPEYLYEIGKTI